MATSTITNTFNDVTLADFDVTATLMPGTGFRIGDNSEVARQVKVTATAGAWSIALERQANITPSSSWWMIHEDLPPSEGGPRVHSISVGASDSTLAAAIITPSQNPALSVYLTQPAADARYLQAGSFKPLATDGYQWISVNGNDDNDGLLFGSPKLTPVAAIAALGAGGGRVVGALGHFDLDFDIPDNVIVEGLGYGTVFTTAATAGNVCSFANGGTGMKLRHCTLEQTGTGGSVGVFTSAAVGGWAIEDVVIDGPFGQAINVYMGGSGWLDKIYAKGVGVAGLSAPGDVVNIYGSVDVHGTNIHGRNCLQDLWYVNKGAASVTLDAWSVYGMPEGVQIRGGCHAVCTGVGAATIKGATGVNSFGMIVQGTVADGGCTGTVIGVTTFRTIAGTLTPLAAISVDRECHHTTVGPVSIEGTWTKGLTAVHTGGSGSKNVKFLGVDIDATNIVSYPIHASAGNNHFGWQGDVTGGAFPALIESDYGTVGSPTNVNNMLGYGIQMNGDHFSIAGGVNSSLNGNSGFLLAGSYGAVGLVQANGNGNTGTHVGYGIEEYHGGGFTADYNTLMACGCSSNADNTLDILVLGTHTKSNYHTGNTRYVAAGAP